MAEGSAYYAEKRKKDEILLAQLKQERSSFIPTWRDCGEYILPRRPRFFTSDVNRGDRRNQKIIDSTATTAARTARAGMMGGITSPARPWFRLTTQDPEVAERANVKRWLHIVANRITTVFIRSNLYNALPIVYADLIVFGTSAMMIEEDFETVLRFYVFPIGSYLIANDDRGKVNTFAREFKMTVAQIVKRWGVKDQKGNILNWHNFSVQVRTKWERGERQEWVDIVHIIQPNDEHDPKRLESKFKKFSSCYYEAGCNDRYLSEKGYDYFPVLCPRWEVTGEDTYGTTCPAIEAMGDIKQLQVGEKRAAQAIELGIKPPMVGSSALKNAKTSILPGDVTYDDSQAANAFRPAFQVQPKVQDLEYKQEQIRARIKKVFYEDLFLMLANDERSNITAREIEARHEEKLLALGPVLEQLNQDLLDPLIDATFDIMVRQSQDTNGNFIEGALIPPPPEELNGIELKVEYVSIMAQAQKLVGIGGLERYTRFAIEVAGVNPDSMKKTDWDQLLDEYGEAVGLSPRVIRPDEDVAAMREEEAAAVQAQQQAELAERTVGAAKTLSETNVEDDSALKRLIDQSQAGQVVPQ